MNCPDCQYPLPAESVPDQIAHWLQHALVEAGMDAVIASIIAEPLLQTSVAPDRLARAFAPVLVPWPKREVRQDALDKLCGVLGLEHTDAVITMLNAAVRIERLEREAELGRAALAYARLRDRSMADPELCEARDAMLDLARQLDAEDI